MSKPPVEPRVALPEFRNPPVAETAISVVFAPIDGWKMAHFTRFAHRAADAYPNVDPQERVIATPIEEFEQPSSSPVPLIIEGGAPTLWWYMSESTDRLIQLQRNRLAENWRRLQPTDPYPGYGTNRELFRSAWKMFTAFLDEQKLSRPALLQVEVDYVNHIERGAGWETTVDLSDVSPLLAARKGDFLPAPEVTLLSERYVIPERRGRLHMTLQPAIRNSDKVELLQLSIGARARASDLDGDDLDSIMSLCDLGHEWIVRGFVELTTSKMQELWGRVQ